MVCINITLHHSKGEIYCIRRVNYCGDSTLIWKDTLGNPNDVISPMTLPSTPKFDNAPRINPHGNHKNWILVVLW